MSKSTQTFAAYFKYALTIVLDTILEKGKNLFITTSKNAGAGGLVLHKLVQTLTTVENAAVVYVNLNAAEDLNVLPVLNFIVKHGTDVDPFLVPFDKTSAALHKLLTTKNNSLSFLFEPSIVPTHIFITNSNDAFIDNLNKLYTDALVVHSRESDPSEPPVVEIILTDIK